jgi:hypothetical protein
MHHRNRVANEANLIYVCMYVCKYSCMYIVIHMYVLFYMSIVHNKAAYFEVVIATAQGPAAA